MRSKVASRFHCANAGDNVKNVALRTPSTAVACRQWCIFETVPTFAHLYIAVDRRRRHVTTVDGRKVPSTAAVRTLLKMTSLRCR